MSDTDVTAPETRRDRQRRELVDELCAEASRQLVEGGSGSVTWRGLARAVGMSPASLYTYFDGVDALFTELIVRNFASLAAATRAGVDRFDEPGDRLLAGIHAYRQWARRHPAEFNLVFTDQLPGYAAEPDGPTVAAQGAIFEPLIEVLAAIDDAGITDPRDVAASSVLGVWGMFHGLVSLEINHHLDWIDGGAHFDRQVRWALDAAGLPAARSDVAGAFEAG